MAEVHGGQRLPLEQGRGIDAQAAGDDDQEGHQRQQEQQEFLAPAADPRLAAAKAVGHAPALA